MRMRSSRIGTRRSLIALAGWITALGLVWAASADAVIISSRDGTGNTSAPPDDPGWAHLGTMGGLSAIYLGNGWMITANHVSLNTVFLDGSSYAPDLGSKVRLSNGDGTFADLKVFALQSLPNLPSLPIRATTPAPGTPLIMAGNAVNRGPSTSWNPPGPGGPYPGFEWGVGKTTRWGTNEVDGYPAGDPFDTVSFYTSFDQGATPHEAQAANGDSGGAVWIQDGGQWELAGLLFAIDTLLPGCPTVQFCNSQPAGLALYENWSYVADLSFYRDEILQIIAVPEPGGPDLLAVGITALLALGRRRMRS